jgi:hypothetical protein
MLAACDVCYRVITLALERKSPLRRGAGLGLPSPIHPSPPLVCVTGIPDIPNYRRPMRYFFHILDGPKVFPDEGGSNLSGPEIAVLQAKALALELTKAGAFCRSNRS